MMDTIKKILRNRLFQMLLFWAVSFFVLLRLFSRTDHIRTIDIIYTLLFHMPVVFAVTIHSYYLIPSYLSKGKNIIYLVMLPVLFTITLFLYRITFNTLSDWIFPGYYLVGVYSGLEIVGVTFIYLLVSSLLEFSKSWFSEQKSKTRVAQLESEKKESELKALRAQINPHFLFNSLNTIYLEALKKSDKSPKLILQLSDMLRYVVDKMEEDKVKVSEELEYLENYIQLQKERLNHPEKVKYQVSGVIENQKISPMLLINFIENCFKHSDLSTAAGYINIEIRITQGELTLTCENNIKGTDKALEVYGGQGIQNAKKRLRLVYPDCHMLNIKERDEIYFLQLKLSLDS